MGATPHRGSLILTLGIIGVSLGGVGMLSGLLFAPCCGLTLVGLGLGIPAWVMGTTDLRLMASGIMDPSGRGPTQNGRVCGIVAVALAGVTLLLMIAGMLFMGIAVLSGAGGSSGTGIGP